MEKIGYVSKQSYYIRCPCCIEHRDNPNNIIYPNSGNNAAVVEANNNNNDNIHEESVEPMKEGTEEIPPVVATEPHQDTVKIEDGETTTEKPKPKEEPFVPSFSTQLMRIVSEEIPDVIPEEPKPTKKRGRKNKDDKRKSTDDATPQKKEVDDYESELDEPEKPSPKRKSTGNSAKKSRTVKQVEEKEEEEENNHVDHATTNEPTRSLAESITMLISKAETIRSSAFSLANMDHIAEFKKDKNRASRIAQWDLVLNKVASGKLFVLTD